MVSFPSPSIFWIVAMVQALGIASLLVTRIGERSIARGMLQSAFFVCLIAVGLTTIMALSVGNSNWHSCAMTLGMMCIGATVDIRRK